MQIQDFDNAVADMARQQAERLRGMGYHFAAAEVDALMPDPIAGEALSPEALIA